MATLLTLNAESADPSRSHSYDKDYSFTIKTFINNKLSNIVDNNLALKSIYGRQQNHKIKFILYVV